MKRAAAGFGSRLRSSSFTPVTPSRPGLVASQCHAGAYANRFVVVVDDDIDPADMDKVIWAMCTRFDPREDHGNPARLLEHGARSDGL